MPANGSVAAEGWPLTEPGEASLAGPARAKSRSVVSPSMKAYRTVEIGREFASVTLDSPEPPVGRAEFLTATLRLPDLVASTRIYLYSPGGPGLAEYFAGLAADWRGWDGDRVWNAVEGEFRLEARHDRVGYVALVVRLRRFAPGHNEGGDWQATATIGIEPGQLTEIADAVAVLLAGR